MSTTSEHEAAFNEENPTEDVTGEAVDIDVEFDDIEIEILDDDDLIELGEDDLAELEVVEAAPPPAPPVQAAPAPAPAPKAKRKKKRLGEMLIDAGFLDDDKLRVALAHQKAHGGKQGSVLVALGMLDEEVLESQLSLQLGINVCKVQSVTPEPAVLELIPEKMIRKHQAIPLREGLADDFEIELDFDGGGSKTELVAGGAPDSWEVVQLGQFILENAVKRRASDVHIEPYEEFCRVRVRVDGVLYTLLTPPKRVLEPLVRRFKRSAGMKVSDQRHPQDGQTRETVGDVSVDLRVSTLPTMFGEKCVTRLLRRDPTLGDLSRLGFRRDQLHAVKEALREPQGLILVTGPTGPGKTTTLHGMVNEITDPDKNIVTLEDPVEAAIPGVNHVPVRDKEGQNYASVLRSILRQDYDVGLVGEIREPDVAAAAVKASLTGHLVISSLHTNGVVETFLRMRDLGVDPWLLAGGVQLVLAQRLLRRTCVKCSRPAPITPDLIEQFQLTDEQVRTASRREPQGCPACLHTGYRGRVAVFESLRPNDAVRRVLRSGGDEERLLELSREMGMVTMIDAGVARALAGETTFAEVRRKLGT